MAQQTCDQITANFTDEYIASHFDETIIRVVICDSNNKFTFTYMNGTAVLFVGGGQISFMLE